MLNNFQLGMDIFKDIKQSEEHGGRNNIVVSLLEHVALRVYPYDYVGQSLGHFSECKIFSTSCEQNGFLLLHRLRIQSTM